MKQIYHYPGCTCQRIIGNNKQLNKHKLDNLYDVNYTTEKIQTTTTHTT